ncbi:hypothetical protein CLV80_10829 [Yoonia maritima]|uniref:Uncharacterized protein n=1 Tax=Yoonia maritima TaxID=1435347 RepID=A0A2T0VX49_9RHOB|nr:hypothetical protein CLV80_10829 [Yoonia maritima]
MSPPVWHWQWSEWTHLIENLRHILRSWRHATNVGRLSLTWSLIFSREVQSVDPVSTAGSLIWLSGPYRTSSRTAALIIRT